MEGLKYYFIYTLSVIKKITKKNSFFRGTPPGNSNEELYFFRMTGTNKCIF